METEKTQKDLMSKWDEKNTNHEIIDKTGGTINKHTQTHQSNNEGTQTVKIAGPVNIVDIYMPFGSMVFFMVKWAIASIPAILILMVLFAIFGGFFLGIFAIFN